MLLARPVTPGDLAWLWGKIRPADKAEVALDYIEPDARDEDLQERIASLFIHYPEGEA